MNARPAPRLTALPAQDLPGGLCVARAAGPRTRLLGLAHLDAPGLPRDLGLRFERCRSVHTFGMRFALDLVWLDAAGAPIRLDADVPPRRVRSCRRARAVLEVHAGRGEAFAAALGASR